MQISLNGSDWRFKAYLGEDWVWRNGEKPDTRDQRWWYTGTVPGSVQHDLLTTGQIADPYYELNSLQAEWAADRTWIYKKAFVVDPIHRGRRIHLHFKGVDYEAQFFLNGRRLGEHRSMFTPAVFEVGDLLRYGEENLISVVIEPAPAEQPQVSKTSRVRTHKSRMNYWWDFCPRMVHQGIWDDVYLDVTGPVRVTDLFVRPRLSPAHDQATLTCTATLNGGSADVTVTVRREGLVVAEGRAAAGQPVFDGQVCGPVTSWVRLELPVAKPDLWWPNGCGDQPLYEAEIRVTGANGEAWDRRTVSFGIRSVELAQNETPDETALPYTFVVNGRKIYTNGWNWVPMDAMYGVERPAKLERLLQLLRRANVNLLRVWGGGLIEKDAFYDLCDRYGIMVWQEFIQSSSGIANKPATDLAFIDLMTAEAEAIIPGKRNHPSLVLWCGGNELTDLDGRPLNDEEPVLAALKAAVERLDPDRFWLATSPTGREFSNTLQAIERDPLGMHDVHGPWEHQGLTAQYTLYNRGAALLHSEFGAEGMTNLKALERTIAPANRWPATRENLVYFHRGSWWVNEPLIQTSFDGISHVVTLQKASQFLQHEALRYALEADRRRQWQCSGTIPWQFNEPYPNAYCTSAVDYYGQPKPAYYGVAAAYEPLHVSAAFPTQAWAGFEAFEADIWVSNAGLSGTDGAPLSVRLVGASGAVYHQEKLTTAYGPNGSVRVHTLRIPMTEVKEEVFFLDLRLHKATNRYLFVKGKTLAPMLTAPATTLAVTPGADGTVTVTNTGGYAALQVRLEDSRPLESRGYPYFNENYFTLLPFESRRVAVDWSAETPAGERQVSVTAWNAGGMLVG